MSKATTVDLESLEARLKEKLPAAYREYVQTQSSTSLEKQGFEPKTLLILNLALQGVEHYEGIDRRFFLNGDGCGNYFFVNLAGDQSKVLLWSHDPPGIEHPNHELAQYLRESEQDNRIDWPIESDELWLCRTPTYGESLLDPITLDEWIEAVRSTAGLKYVGYREGQNPFTGEVIRADSPGYTVVTSYKNRHISLFQGRARLKDLPGMREIATALASKLKAHLLSAESSG